MTIDDKIRDEKLQYNINRDAAKLSPLSSGKIDKYEYITDEEKLPSDQSRTIEQAKISYFSLGKAFEKQLQTFENQGIKQAEALKVLKLEENQQGLKSFEIIFPKEMTTNKIKSELDEIERIEYAIVRHYLKYKTSQKLFHFQKFKAINVFGNSILSGEITISDADEK